jgi:hypothetical protein
MEKQHGFLIMKKGIGKTEIDLQKTKSGRWE